MDYKIIRSRRRTVSVEVKNNLDVIVRVPMRMKDADIRQIVLGRSVWIEKHLRLAQQRKDEQGPIITKNEIIGLANAAKTDIPKRVAFFAENMGVSFGNITIRSQKTRWGSCSSKGNLSFNCLLMLCPVDVRDYVVVHELCHRIELNHSARFWSNVERVLPDYKTRRKWLKTNGERIIGRMT